MIDPAQGVLLIADPFLKDPNFLRTVVFICEHQDHGSIGFVINRLQGVTLDELLPEAEGFKVPVYYGGPVQQDTIHFLHQCPDEIPGGQEVINGIYWGGDFEKLMSLIAEDQIDQSKFRLFLGYSGWDKEQLDEELKEKSWLTVEADKQLVFHKKVGDTWKDAIKTLGGDYEMMINFPLDPQMN